MVFKVFEQKHGALCGYHCLFNLITLSKHFKSNDNIKKNYYLEKLNNVAKYIFFKKDFGYFIEG